MKWPLAKHEAAKPRVQAQMLLDPSLVTGQFQEKCPVGLIMAALSRPNIGSCSLQCLGVGSGGG